MAELVAQNGTSQDRRANPLRSRDPRRRELEFERPSPPPACLPRDLMIEWSEAEENCHALPIRHLK
jgi:hypothetical protein